MDKSTFAEKVIDALGGTGEVARLCQVSDPAISAWKKEGIPKARLMFLRLAKPKIFKGELAENPKEETKS